MTELEPQFLEIVSTSAQELRTTFSALQAGVFASGDLKVASGSGLSVDVAGGIALVQGTNITDQGLYRCRNDATRNSAAFDLGGIPANASGQPRLDQVIARVMDQTHDSSGLRKWRLEYVAGVGTAGATLDTRNGAISNAGLGNNWLRLADVLIPTGAVTVIAGNIRDRRTWAKGFRYFVTLADFAAWSTGTLTVVTGSQIRAELAASNGLVATYKASRNNTNAVADRSQTSFHYDAAQQPSAVASQHLDDIPSSLWRGIHTRAELANVAAGSHLVEWRVARNATATYTESGPQVCYEEIIRQNANNS